MTTSTQTLSCQKHLFSLDPNVHYLNCAYMSPFMKSVERVGIEGIQLRRTPSNITSQDFFTRIQHAREFAAELIGVPEPNQIALIPSASYAMSSIARNLSIESGQNIVILDEQFPSNVYIWQRICPPGATIHTVKPPDQLQDRGKLWNESILEAIDDNTAVVAMSHIHWASGTRFDVERISKRAREMGAAFIIDGTQSIGSYPFDMANVQPDALICATYKCLMGPYSLGFAYFSPRFNNGIPLEENWITRLGSENFSRLIHYETEYQPGAVRYDAGERSNPILVPMMNEGLKQLIEWGVENIQAYCQNLIQPLVETLPPLGYWMEDDAWRASHLFGIGMPDQLDVNTLSETLKANNIMVSVRGRYIRVSPHVYNDEADIDALLDVLKSMVQ